MLPRGSKLICALILAGSARVAFGFAVVLTNEAEHARITIADYPGQRDVVVVAWQDVPGVTPASGAMVYSADRADHATRYFAIGGAGRFALVERGRRWSRGTAAPAFDVVSDDPQRPLAMATDTSQRVDVPALLAQYGAFENIAAADEPRAVIDAAVAAKAAQANQACGSRLAAKLQWQTFATPASVRLAKQAVSILQAIEAVCADHDYAAAVRKVSELRVDYQADAGALRLERTGTTLTVRLSDTSFNPRETAQRWLTDHL
jgi:hypothetical protein